MRVDSESKCWRHMPQSLRRMREEWLRYLQVARRRSVFGSFTRATWLFIALAKALQPIIEARKKEAKYADQA